MSPLTAGALRCWPRCSVRVDRCVVALAVRRDSERRSDFCDFWDFCDFSDLVA
ncbi:hypothetical protein AB0K04_26845 [Micromonospora coxensis]|uniref:hypothetical protein n=1 Tax=Micromonospora coxensis TaxID=356852 RepID=UPI00342CE48E